MHLRVEPSRLRQLIKATGIGYAGIDGAWWRLAVEPFVLPATVASELAQMGRAIFGLFDTVSELYGTAAGAAAGLNQLLEHNVPAPILRLIDQTPVLTVRPDFQLVPLPGGGYQPVATELEICPSAQGYVHAMQVGYGLTPDLVPALAQILQGRPLLIVGTAQWSEFLFEQLAFCRALAEVGAQGHVLYDLPIRELARGVAAGQRWQPPLFGVPTKPADWDDDVLGRIERLGLTPYLWPQDEEWPSSVGNAVVFRFGYFDCFAADKLQRLVTWRARGATMLNPTHFIFDSKVVMAALQLPAIRQQIEQRTPGAVAALQRCLPTTHLLEPTVLDALCAEPADWVIKFAGYDRGNQAWGGRSLHFGAQHTAADWRARLQASLALPWPVVAQRATPSAQVDLAYWDEADCSQWLREGTTRLRVFLLRNPAQAEHVLVGGAHLTAVTEGQNVAEGLTAVQTPVRFSG